MALATPIADDYEEKRLDCRCYATEADLERVLVRDRPDVIITIGNRASFPNLAHAPSEIRKRWLHYDTLPDCARLGIQAYTCHITNLFPGPGADELPLLPSSPPPTGPAGASGGPSTHCRSRPIPIGSGSSWTTPTTAGTPSRC